MRFLAFVITLLLLAAAWLAPGVPAHTGRAVYRSALGLAYSPDGRTLAVCDETAGEVVLLRSGSGAVRGRVPAREPRGVAWSPDGRSLYVAEGAGGVLVVDGRAARVTRRFAAGPGTTALALGPRGRSLLATCADTRTVEVLDAATGRRVAAWPLTAEPYAVAVAARRGVAIVGHLLSAGDAGALDAGASLTFLDLRSRKAHDVKLPAGSTNVRGIAVSPDERWAYVVHCIGNTALPTTHLDGGWVNNDALTLIDLRTQQPCASVLLDTSEGAADPWGVGLTDRGKTLWVALSGVRSLARVDLARLHALLDTASLPRTKGLVLDTLHQDNSASGVTVLGRFTLDLEGCIRRVPLPADGPRELAVSPDGGHVAAGLYFGGRVAVVNTAGAPRITEFRLGAEPKEDLARRGERLFHDATQTRLTWLSCATCHPNGRADALNWDLLNDGAGNPKNTRSVLNAPRRSPLMSHGIRKDAHACTVAGFRYIEFREAREEDVSAVIAYMASLKPRTSPYRTANGGLTPAARRGKALFEGRALCASCHTGALHTDGQLHDVGTRQPWDSTATFATPSLTEAWRTAPYLHDGGAATVRELLTRRNPRDEHGQTRGLTNRQLQDLEAYVLSL